MDGRKLFLHLFRSVVPKMRLFYIKSEDGFQCHGILVARLYLELMEDAGVFIVCLEELADGFIFQEEPCIYFFLQHIFQLSFQRNWVGELVIEGYVFSHRKAENTVAVLRNTIVFGIESCPSAYIAQRRKLIKPLLKIGHELFAYQGCHVLLQQILRTQYLHGIGYSPQ